MGAEVRVCKAKQAHLPRYLLSVSSLPTATAVRTYSSFAVWTLTVFQICFKSWWTYKLIFGGCFAKTNLKKIKIHMFLENIWLRSFHSRTRISWRKYWTKFKSIKILLKTREEKKPGRVSVVDSKQVTWRVTWITSMTSRLQNTNLHATYVITPLRLQSMGGIPMRLLRFDLCYRRFCGSSQGSCPQESFVSLSKVWFHSQEKGLFEKSHSTRVHDVKT